MLFILVSNSYISYAYFRLYFLITPVAIIRSRYISNARSQVIALSSSISLAPIEDKYTSVPGFEQVIRPSITDKVSPYILRYKCGVNVDK